MVCGSVKFAAFGIFLILASAHFRLAVNILANFAIFAACLEPPLLVIHKLRDRSFFTR